MTAILEAKSLAKRYGDVNALINLDLVVGAGEIVCLLGANGAGKSTTLNLFLGFIAPTQGEATVCGVRPVSKPQEARNKLAYIPETVALYQTLTGLENLEFLHAISDAPKLSRDQALGYLGSAGLDNGAALRRVSSYSKGMRQKVALAAAFARGARAWLLDEPLSGLDPHAANELTEAIRRAAAEGTAVLMATHDLFRARDLATRIGIMKQGRLVELIEPTELDHAALERIYLQHMAEERAA